MNITELILSRRNIKKFKNDPISNEKVVEMLQVAAYAPNHRMHEPWEIMWIGPETRAQLNHKNDFGGAPVVLAVLSTPAATALDRDEHVEAVSCFIQNFMLLAHAEGYGTGWSSMGASARAREILGVQEGYEVIGIIPVGYAEEVPPAAPRTEINQKLIVLS